MGIFHACVLAMAEMAMHCKEKPRLLCKKQLQALAAELEKMETEDLMEEVCKQVGSGYHVSYINDCQHLWTEIAEQQCKRLASIIAAVLHYFESALQGQREICAHANGVDGCDKSHGA